MLTIASVYKPGNGFCDDYVYRLRDGAAKFCKAPHRFVCLTHQRLRDVETIVPERTRVGYWNKLELFRKGLFDGPVAYFDLDTMIIDEITDIVTTPYKFAALTNTNPKSRPDELVLNSGFMIWDGTQDLSAVRDEFDGDYERYEQDWRRWGDQGRIQDALPIPFDSITNDFPGRVVSYKIRVLPDKKVPADVSAVMFHGCPRPHEIRWELP